MKKWVVRAALAGAFAAFAGFSGSVLGQSDLELAEFYYNEGSYEQAKLYLEQLYKRDKTNKVYDMYYASLLALDDFETAESLVLKRLKRRANRAGAYVDLGGLYLHFEKREQAREAFEEALTRLQPGRSQAIQLANAFVKLNELDLALEVYERAAALGTTDLDYQLANLQGMRGDFPGMIDAYVTLLLYKKGYLRNVQTSLIRNLRFAERPEMSDLLRLRLMRAAQQHPDAIVYTEMLVWYCNQIEDFAEAFVYAKALDLRLNENGHRLMALAAVAAENRDLETAEKSYRYVAAKGPGNAYFYSARTDALEMRKRRVTEMTPPPLDEITACVAAYRTSLADLGLRNETAGMAIDLAELEAFYLHETERAIARLEDVTALPGLYDRIAAIAKLLLGDIWVFQDAIWDASLLFSQVELDFKDDPLGHEAKFRNARISYYAGDFDWAQTQLDALKASTSKLVSNDAIDLSLLITDNYALDTIVRPMALFAEADLLQAQHRNEEARLKLDSIVTAWPGHALTDEILMEHAQMFIEEARYDEALHPLQEVVALHFDDILADDALMELGKLYDGPLHLPDSAFSHYERLMFDYPGSLHVVEARRRYREMAPAGN
jgi:tetratricopeptide (TPR) repeat protein